MNAPMRILPVLVLIFLSLSTFACGFAPVPSMANSTRHKSVSLDATKQSEEAPRGVVMNTAIGGVVLAGGVMGFIKAGSKASLIAGSTFGSLLFAAAALISSKKRSGSMLGCGVAGMLGYTMGKKFMLSGKFIPSGFIASLSVAAAVYNLVEIWRTRKQ